MAVDTNPTCQLGSLLNVFLRARVLTSPYCASEGPYPPRPARVLRSCRRGLRRPSLARRVGMGSVGNSQPRATDGRLDDASCRQTDFDINLYAGTTSRESVGLFRQIAKKRTVLQPSMLGGPSPSPAGSQSSQPRQECDRAAKMGPFVSASTRSSSANHYQQKTCVDSDWLRSSRFPIGLNHKGHEDHKGGMRLSRSGSRAAQLRRDHHARMVVPQGTGAVPAIPTAKLRRSQRRIRSPTIRLRLLWRFFPRRLENRPFRNHYRLT